ncbi:hypothetical protein SAMN05216276_110420 [Streptosporangium subroseum]|uniref:Uncharacterized protein n=1 Tax=Streptosporangium subroseum TaxID=106412 RepID=A0A239P9P2_9ACTN|nr:hypothetical protein SAMN05216276_110420 [Streptosporangium subroseum]
MLWRSRRRILVYCDGPDVRDAEADFRAAIETDEGALYYYAVFPGENGRLDEAADRCPPQFEWRGTTSRPDGWWILNPGAGALGIRRVTGFSSTGNSLPWWPSVSGGPSRSR